MTISKVSHWCRPFVPTEVSKITGLSVRSLDRWWSLGVLRLRHGESNRHTPWQIAGLLILKLVPREYVNANEFRRSMSRATRSVVWYAIASKPEAVEVTGDDEEVNFYRETIGDSDGEDGPSTLSLLSRIPDVKVARFLVVNDSGRHLLAREIAEVIDGATHKARTIIDLAAIGRELAQHANRALICVHIERIHFDE